MHANRALESSRLIEHVGITDRLGFLEESHIFENDACLFHSYLISISASIPGHPQVIVLLSIGEAQP